MYTPNLTYLICPYIPPLISLVLLQSMSCSISSRTRASRRRTSALSSPVVVLVAVASRPSTGVKVAAASPSTSADRLGRLALQLLQRQGPFAVIAPTVVVLRVNVGQSRWLHRDHAATTMRPTAAAVDSAMGSAVVPPTSVLVTIVAATARRRVHGTKR